MENKDRYTGNSGNSLLRAAGGAFVLLAAALLGCGSDNSTGPARVRLASSVSASAVGCGTVKVLPAGATDSVDVQTYNLSATWQATGTWKAIFVNAGTGKILATTAIDATQTKTSVIVDKDGKVSSCQFKRGDIAYAILYPDGSSPVQSDADLTPTLTVGS